MQASAKQRLWPTAMGSLVGALGGCQTAAMPQNPKTGHMQASFKSPFTLKLFGTRGAYDNEGPQIYTRNRMIPLSQGPQ